jgi:hypothetical protein
MHELAPRDALDPLEHDLWTAGRVDADVINGNDVRMLERAGDPRLPKQLEDLLRLT